MVLQRNREKLLRWKLILWKWLLFPSAMNEIVFYESSLAFFEINFNKRRQKCQKRGFMSYIIYGLMNFQHNFLLLFSKYIWLRINCQISLIALLFLQCGSLISIERNFQNITYICGLHLPFSKCHLLFQQAI